MNKQEWFREFRALVLSLPESEQERIVQFYEELYLDQVESGKGESAILEEFGDPRTAAYRILSEEYAPLREAGTTDGEAAPVRGTDIRKKFSWERLLLFVLLLPVYIVLPILLITAWACLVSVFVSGIAVAISGPVAIVIQFAREIVAPLWIAQAGFGIFCLGAGILLAMGSWKLFSLLAAATKRCVAGTCRFFFVKVRP